MDLDPLGELVDRHQDVPVAARGRPKWSHRIKAPKGQVLTVNSCIKVRL
jgi:hypothetical protein